MCPELSLFIISFNSANNFVTLDIIIFILQMRKLRLRDGMTCPKSIVSVKECESSFARFHQFSKEVWNLDIYVKVLHV